LEKRLLEDPLKAKIYQDIINKYVEDGIAEEVPANEIKPVVNRPVFYLPHHAVIREDRQKTKTRVVFDALYRSWSSFTIRSMWYSFAFPKEEDRCYK
jgi:hypothetical protein